MKAVLIDFNEYKYLKGGKSMGIGALLRERMDYFKISEEKLSDEALVDMDELNSILNNDVSYSEIDEITLEFISNVVYCKPEYFIDEAVRKRDIVNACYNRGDSTPKSNKIKGILQSFTEDLAFLIELKGE
ncbi:hypothetical protein [Clostridium sp. C8-1-8]|uniref:hypothetical protein n=1 Tax=Clostridium sp. C8-1-8 TaxID=2698831 RepID=UPI00136A736D|nr:hypothetical protein [Clostridium sp. C8-1-8]